MATRLRLTPDAPEPDAIGSAVGVLRRGGIVAYATDTLYGLAVDPRQDAAIARLFAAKGRPAESAVPLIAADLAQARLAGEFGPEETRLAGAFWPGPLSLVVPAREAVARGALAGGRTVAIRVPDHPVARALAAAHGFCITSTSANLAGGPPPAGPELDPLLAARIDILLDSGPAPGGLPSTLVAVSNGRPVLLRAGAVAWERVLRSQG